MLQANLNAHGDLAALRSGSGSPAWRTDYDPFGQQSATTGTAPVNLGYQAMYTDTTTGAVDMGFRHYDPTTGRFGGRDNIIGALTKPVTLNRYLYANGDPVNYFDPDGHWAVSDSVKKAVGDAVTSATSAVSTAAGSVDWNAVKSGASTVVNDAKRTFNEVRHDPVVAAVAGVAVGVAVGGGCLLATGGVGSIGCLALGGAAGGAVTGAMLCPEGQSGWKRAGIGAAVGALGAGTITASIAAGAVSGAAADITSQLLTTGTVDPGQVAASTLIGGVFGGSLAAGGRISAGLVSRVRSSGRSLTNDPREVSATTNQSAVAAGENSRAPLLEGRAQETASLLLKGLKKNTKLWKPSEEQINSAAFKVIVGSAKYSPGGRPVGVIVDSVGLELKHGSSPLESSYQLRLMTYRALVVNEPLTVSTTRPVPARLADYFTRWGVNVDRVQ